MAGPRKKLTVKQIEAMKSLYMKYMSISELAKEFNVSRTTVNHHININSWQAERKLAETELLSSFSDAKKGDFVKMTQSAVNIMSRSLHALATRHDPPSINEATRAADILKTLDNILRLDEGKPTDIVENQDKPLDDDELREKLSKDPFADIEEKNEKLN